MGFIAAALMGLLLLSAVEDFPAWGDAHSPASDDRLSTYYIERTADDTTVPNIVTAVLADYRGYDTMFETVVIFTAGLAILAIIGLGNFRDSFVSHHKHQRIHVKEPSDLVIRITVRMLVPVIQLFALYVIAHGHHSPGGGFQGGVIFGASYVLMALSRDLHPVLKHFTPRIMITLACVGILIYAGIGALAMVQGGNFLDYGALDSLLGVDWRAARSLSMLGVEIGVAFTVSSVMVLIYAELSSGGKLSELEDQ